MSALLPKLISKLKKICAVENDVNAVGLSTGVPKVWARYKSDSCRWGLLLAGMLHCFTVFAQTPVSGAIAVDMRWDIAGAPYIVSGDVVVQNGATLSVDPGVDIYMAAGSSLKVQAGAIQALGNAAKPIRVLSDRSRLGQGGAAGDWKQWVFGSGTVNTRLEHVEFAHGSGLVVNGSAPVFNYLNIHEHTGPAISVDLAASPSGVGNRASANGINGVAVPAGDISGSIKWGIRGIPYVVASGTVSVGTSPSVTSIAPDTVQPGETVTATVVGSRLAGLASASFAYEGLTAQVLEGATDNQAQLSITAEASVVPGNAPLRLLVDAGSVHIPDALKVIQSQPVLTALTPSTVYLGQGVVDVLLSGRGMTTQSLALINGGNVPTVYLSPTELRASVTVPASVTNLSVRLQTPDPVNPGQFLNSNQLVLPVATAQLAVSPSAASVSKGATKAFTVTLPYAAPVGGISLNLVSSVPTVATVPASLAIPEGQRSATFQLDGLDLGATTLTISKLGFVSAQALVTVTPPPTLTLAPSSITLGVGRAADLTIQSSIPAGASGLPVALSSSNPSVANLSSSVVIPAGGSTATVSLSTLATGSATITAQAADFVNGSASITVRPISLNMPPGVLVAPGLARSVPITLSDPAPDGGLEIQLSSSVEGVVSVPTKLTVAAGQSTVNFTLTGVAVGTASVVATATGYQQATMPVTVEAVTISVGSPAVSQISVAEGTSQRYSINLSKPAPVGGVAIDLTTTDPAKALVTPASMTIAEGQTSAGVVLANVMGVAKGSTLLSASAPGLNASSTPVIVTEKPELAFSKSSVTVGKGLQTYIYEVYIHRRTGGSNYASNQALTVNLHSSDPGRVSVPVTVTIPAGSSNTSFYVTGVDLTNGTPVMIDATADGYSAPTTKLSANVVVPVFNFSALDTARSPASARDNFQVFVTVPGASYPNNQTAAADFPINLAFVEASPTGIVEGFYGVQTAGAPVGQVILRKDETYSDMVYVGVPTVAGSYKVQASTAGIATGTSPIVMVSQPALGFSKSSVTVGKSMTAYYWEVHVNRTVNGQSFSGNDALTVNLSSSDPTKVSVPATVTIPAGSSSTWFYVTGVDFADTVPVTIDATATGYSAPATKLAANVVAPVFNFSGLDTARSPASVRDNFQIYVTVPGASYPSNQTAAADLPISLDIVEPSPAGIVDGFFSAQTGGVPISQVILRKGGSYADTVYVGVPTVAGSYKVQASVAGVSTGSSASVTVSSPELSFSRSSVTVGKGLKNYQYEVYVNRTVNGQSFNGNDALTVNLSSSDPTKASVPVTVTIPAGSSNAVLYVTGVDLTNGTPVTIDATAEGYSAPTTKLSANVVAPLFNFSALDTGRSPASARDDFRVYVTVPGASYSYNQTAAVDLPINLGIVEASPTGVVDGFYNAPTGGLSVSQVMLRKDSTYSDMAYVGVPTVAGSYKVQATAAGVSTATSGIVTVTSPELRFSKSSVTVGKGLNTYSQEVYVYRAANGQPSSGDEALTVNLACSSPAVCRVPASVTIPAGSSSVYFRVEGVDLGNTTIVASAVGHTLVQELAVSVITPGLFFSGPSGTAIGGQSNFYIYLTVPGAYYSSNQTAVGDMTINLTSSAPDVATVPATVLIRSGQNLSDMAKLIGVGAGKTTITASGSGLSSAASSAITITP